MVIVGGGASGVLSALHLLWATPERVRVVFIEPRGELGYGIAYGTSDPGHLLNVRAGCLSARPDQPGHFTQWARQHTAAHGESFLPRSLYGNYLRSLLGPVEHIRAHVRHAIPVGGRVQIVLSNGTHRSADRVVLAPGSSPPQWPAPLRGADRRWIGDPWRPGALSEVTPGKPVLLVGTGLTAVDVALSLHAAGHRQVVATSRRGLLPSSHPEQPHPPLRLVPPRHPTARSLLAWAREARAEAGDWGAVVEALRPHTDNLWGAMTTTERARLLRHIHRRWEIHRHRMAPPVADRIDAMRELGELSIAPGGIRSAKTDRRGIHVELADRRLRFGAVINCTGPTADVRHSTNPLIQRLLDHRIVRPGPLALGLDTDADGCLPDTDSALWLVGPLRRGHRWETTAIPEIRTQAAALPHSLWQQRSTIGA